MPWSTNRPQGNGTAAKYRTPEHRRERAAMKAKIERDGQGWCAQPICLWPTRLILPDMAWCAGHDVTGTYYIGPVHEKCNRSDGARQGRARQNPPLYRDWW